MSEMNTENKTIENKITAVENIANNIDIIVDSASIQEAKEEDNINVIKGSARTKRNPVSNIENKDDGVFRSKAADKAFNKLIDTEKRQPEKVALWSNKNIRWEEVGTLKKGYNIVHKEASKRWLTKEGIRTATPDEIATYYDKK